jgi:hypothetical protein
VQAYKAQVAVEQEFQLIVGQAVTQAANDKEQVAAQSGAAVYAARKGIVEIVLAQFPSSDNSPATSVFTSHGAGRPLGSNRRDP